MQGKWVDNVAVQSGNKKGFAGRYGPMFTLYTSAGYARFYGAFLLLKHVVVIWLIASTVDKELASDPDTAHLGAPTPVLIGLIAVNVFQLLFLLCLMPFNDLVENIVQAVVAVQQALFFVFLVMEEDTNVHSSSSNATQFVTAAALHEDAAGSDLGQTLNYVNLVAMVLVVLNATRGPIMGLRGACVKCRKCLMKVFALILPCLCSKVGMEAGQDFRELPFLALRGT